MKRLAHLGRIYGAIALWTIVVFPSSVLVTLVTGSHRIGHRVHARFWGRRILRTAGVDLHVHGIDRVDPDRPYVFMINHGSHLSGFAAAAALPHQWRAVLDARLRWIPVFGWIAMLAGHVFIDRSRTERARRRLDRAVQRVRGGISVLGFPEGRWNGEARLLPFRKGLFHFAVATGVPVVPLTVVETVRGPAERIVRLDLHVDPPIASRDVPSLLADTRAAMERHAIHGRLRHA